MESESALGRRVIRRKQPRTGSITVTGRPWAFNASATMRIVLAEVSIPFERSTKDPL